MENQALHSPARVLYEELRESQDTGLLDTWPAPREPAPHEADEPFAAVVDTPAAEVGAIPESDDVPAQTPELATRHATATDHGDRDRIEIDQTCDPDSVETTNPMALEKVEPLHAVDGGADGGSNQSRSSLAAIIRLQSTEIEHLALENDRLAARLDAVRQLHEDEQTQRRDLEQQLREASADNEPPAPAFDVDEVRRAAREGMSAEIKPVLMAILDLLESTLPRAAEPAKPTDPVLLSPPASLAAEVMDDFKRLPAILTRPLEELTGGSGTSSSGTSSSGTSGSTPDRLAALPAQVPPHDTRMRRPEPPHHEAPRHEARASAVRASAVPSVFAWTNLFS